MASGHTNLQASDGTGKQVSLQHTSTDSPILPAGNLKELQQIDPNLVGWVLNETEIEAKHRRTETSRVNTFIFIERMSGVISGALVAVFGLGASAYLVLQGHDVAGASLGGVTLVSIVAVLVTHNKKPDTESKDSEPVRKPNRRK